MTKRRRRELDPYQLANAQGQCTNEGVAYGGTETQERDVILDTLILLIELSKEADRESVNIPGKDIPEKKSK